MCFICRFSGSNSNSKNADLNNNEQQTEIRDSNKINNKTIDHQQQQIRERGREIWTTKAQIKKQHHQILSREMRSREKERFCESDQVVVVVVVVVILWKWRSCCCCRFGESDVFFNKGESDFERVIWRERFWEKKKEWFGVVAVVII
jgi:hypothetical protein